MYLSKLPKLLLMTSVFYSPSRDSVLSLIQSQHFANTVVKIHLDVCLNCLMARQQQHSDSIVKSLKISQSNCCNLFSIIIAYFSVGLHLLCLNSALSNQKQLNWQKCKFRYYCFIYTWTNGQICATELLFVLLLFRLLNIIKLLFKFCWSTLLKSKRVISKLTLVLSVSRQKVKWEAFSGS